MKSEFELDRVSLMAELKDELPHVYDFAISSKKASLSQESKISADYIRFLLDHLDFEWWRQRGITFKYCPSNLLPSLEICLTEQHPLFLEESCLSTIDRTVRAECFSNIGHVPYWSIIAAPGLHDALECAVRSWMQKKLSQRRYIDVLLDAKKSLGQQTLDILLKFSTSSSIRNLFETQDNETLQILGIRNSPACRHHVPDMVRNGFSPFGLENVLADIIVGTPVYAIVKDRSTFQSTVVSGTVFAYTEHILVDVRNSSICTTSYTFPKHGNWNENLFFSLEEATSALP